MLQKLERQIQKDNESLSMIYVLLKGVFFIIFLIDFSAVCADYS